MKPNYDAAHAVVSAAGGYTVGLLPQMFAAALGPQFVHQRNPQLALVLEAISDDLRVSHKDFALVQRSREHANTLAALAAALRMPA